MTQTRSLLGLATLGLLSFPTLATAQTPAPVTDAEAADLTSEQAAGDDDLQTRPPEKGRGALVGVVSDGKTAEGIFEAQVAVVGRKEVATADIDGRFRLDLPPGVYELRVYYELYRAERVKNVTVSAGRIQALNVALQPDESSQDEAVIEAAPDRASAQAQLVIRRNAAHVGDALSAQEIAKTPDKNAAEAAKRIVGASIVGDRYVYVRGLGERYTNAQLDGAPLPSPEPDRQAVPLDLFPSVVLSDLTVIKTFTPDIPGDFAGGSLLIGTREPPEDLLFQASLSAGFNSASTFQQRLTYQGSSLDWLGIDAGARALPDSIPDYKVVKLGPKPDGTTITRDELTQYGRDINAYMSTRETLNLPNGSGSLVVGRSHDLGGERKLGYLAALTYSRRFPARDGEIIRTYTEDVDNPGGLKLLNDYKAETGSDVVTWGGLAKLRYAFSRNHALSLTGLTSRASENQARVISGFNEERGANIEDTRLRFVSRSLWFGKLAGEHTFSSLDRARLDWHLSLSNATSYEPDTRETVYVEDTTSGTYSFDRGTLSGSHFFADQDDKAYGGGFDFSQPLSSSTPTKMKVGALANVRKRTFEARRFRFTPRPGVDPSVFRLSPDELFTYENIGTVFELEEYTRQDDAYDAEQSLVAGYVMTDISFLPWLRVIAGARMESSSQTLDSFDPFAAEVTQTHTEIDNLDLMPSLSVIFKTSDSSNLRFAVSRTVARPELRELSPFAYTDYFGAREILGNPDLDRTRIVNADVRYEIFPSPGEVLAASLFYKRFDAPIEQIIIASNQGIITYANADSARNLGAELEAQKSLGFLHSSLTPLSLLANLTLVSSEVTLAEGGIQTNAKRPLAGQSPFVVNAGLDYVNDQSGTRARVLYNVFGRRIAQVGQSGLPDVYEQPQHKLDLTVAQKVGAHLDLKLSVENLLDSPVQQTQGEEANDGSIVLEYHTGTTLSVGASYTY